MFKTGYNKMKMDQLKELCEDKGVDTEGFKKADMIEALEAFDAVVDQAVKADKPKKTKSKDGEVKTTILRKAKSEPTFEQAGTNNMTREIKGE